MAAGLERDVERRAARVLGAGVEGGPLGVRLAMGGVEALADHLAVAHHDRADERVGADPAAPAVRQLDGAREVGGIGVEGERHGA
jgi:hypothetical protein